MLKLNPAYVYLAVGIALIMGWFYWYEVRPEQIQKDCAATVLMRSKDKDAQWVTGWTKSCVDAGGTDYFLGALIKRDAANEETQPE